MVRAMPQKLRKRAIDLKPNECLASDLSRGKTEEILGKVQHSGMTVTIYRYGKPVAQIVPYVPPDSVVSDPTQHVSGG